MQDKELIARGAECICGDLILNRKVVGHYRNGQFIITPEGTDELNNVVEIQATVVTETKAPKAAVAAKTTKAPKAAVAAKTTTTAELPEGLDPGVDPDADIQLASEGGTQD